MAGSTPRRSGPQTADGWLPDGYAELVDLTPGHAAEASLALSRLVTDRAEEAVAVVLAAAERGEPLDLLALDATAGAALAAGLPEQARRVAEIGLAAPDDEDETTPGVARILLDIKAFAAACVTGDPEAALAHGERLLVSTEDETVAAIVWSGWSVLYAAAADVDGVRRCRDAYRALHIPEELVLTRIGTRELIELAVAHPAVVAADGASGSAPVEVTEEWARRVLESPPLVAMIRSARDVGLSLVAPTDLGELTARRQAVLQQLASGATTTMIAHRLGVAVRTVQSDVESLKAIHGVTSRAALVAASQPPTGTESPYAALTARQAAVAELVKAGYTNRGIAAALGISQRTVERHVADACRRLGVSGRTALGAH